MQYDAIHVLQACRFMAPVLLRDLSPALRIKWRDVLPEAIKDADGDEGVEVVEEQEPEHDVGAAARDQSDGGDMQLVAHANGRGNGHGNGDGSGDDLSSMSVDEEDIGDDDDDDDPYSGRARREHFLPSSTSRRRASSRDTSPGRTTTASVADSAIATTRRGSVAGHPGGKRRVYVPPDTVVLDVSTVRWRLGTFDDCKKFPAKCVMLGDG